MKNPDPNRPSVEADESDEFEDFLYLAEMAQEEVPGLGTIRRLYRLVKQKLSKEYREEISRLRKKEKILVGAIDQQSENAKILRNYIQSLELKIDSLNEELADVKGKLNSQRNEGE